MEGHPAHDSFDAKIFHLRRSASETALQSPRRSKSIASSESQSPPPPPAFPVPFLKERYPQQSGPNDVDRPTLVSRDGSTSSYQSSIFQEELKKPWNPDQELRKVSRGLLRVQKYTLLFLLFSINGVLIWAFHQYPQHWYIFLPFLSLNTISQVVFALSITVSAALSVAYRTLFRIKDKAPQPLEKFIMLLPCYNEDRVEVETSLTSLVEQVKIDNHPRMIMIVVDGDVKAPGETRTTQDFLLNDMFADGERRVFTNGYCARDGFFMTVTVQHGRYKGVPYVIIGKKYNQGKRDSLCVARSFLWHYKNRSGHIATMFNPDFFNHLGSILMDAGLDTVDYLCGMDGDTVFDKDCVYELIKAIRRGGPKVVGVCGAVLVKFDEKPWGFCGNRNLLQNTEYNVTQGLRREFQSRVTGKVNCLPGCCQLIRVEEATFGDVVLRQRFGHVPKPNDTMTQQIMGVYSEDSIHASIIFSQFPKSQTRQALKARAFTTAPQSWSVYLSQRKRWALGSKSNELVMIFRPGILWIERLCSLITIVTWWVGPFVVAALATLVIAFVRHGAKLFDNNLFVGLISVLLFRYVYSFLIIVWLPHNLMARLRFFVGFWIYLFVSPFMNIIILIYALFHCDEFSWGKTRAVSDEEKGDGESTSGAHGGPPGPAGF